MLISNLIHHLFSFYYIDSILEPYRRKRGNGIEIPFFGHPSGDLAPSKEFNILNRNHFEVLLYEELKIKQWHLLSAFLHNICIEGCDSINRLHSLCREITFWDTPCFENIGLVQRYISDTLGIPCSKVFGRWVKERYQRITTSFAQLSQPSCFVDIDNPYGFDEVEITWVATGLVRIGIQDTVAVVQEIISNPLKNWSEPEFTERLRKRYPFSSHRSVTKHQLEFYSFVLRTVFIGHSFEKPGRLVHLLLQFRNWSLIKANLPHQNDGTCKKRQRTKQVHKNFR